MQVFNDVTLSIIYLKMLLLSRKHMNYFVIDFGFKHMYRMYAKLVKQKSGLSSLNSELHVPIKVR